MSREWLLALLVVFIAVYSREWFVLSLVMFIAKHVTRMVYKRRTAKSSSGQSKWKHFSWQTCEWRVALIPHDLVTVVEVRTATCMTDFSISNVCSNRIKFLNVRTNTQRLQTFEAFLELLHKAAMLL
jgi:hypothetical protein